MLLYRSFMEKISEEPRSNMGTKYSYKNTTMFLFPGEKQFRDFILT